MMKSPVSQRIEKDKNHNPKKQILRISWEQSSVDGVRALNPGDIQAGSSTEAKKKEDPAALQDCSVTESQQAIPHASTEMQSTSLATTSSINHTTSLSTIQSTLQPPDQVLLHEKDTEVEGMKSNTDSNKGLQAAGEKDQEAAPGLDDDLVPIPSSSQAACDVQVQDQIMKGVEMTPSVGVEMTPSVARTDDLESVDRIAQFIKKTNIAVPEDYDVMRDTVKRKLNFGESMFGQQTQPQTEFIRFTKKKRISKSQRSGLIFPVTRFTNKLKKGRYARHVGVGAGVYMAGVLEYLVAEVLELAGNFTQHYGRVRITPRSLLLTMKHDTELDELSANVVIPQGGVRPCIHPALLPPTDDPDKPNQPRKLM